MRKLITMLMFVSAIGFAQPKLDSLSIYYPTKHLKLKTLKNLDSLDYHLNRLNRKFKTDEFIIHYYKSDGIIMRCRVKPIKEKPKQLITI